MTMPPYNPDPYAPGSHVPPPAPTTVEPAETVTRPPKRKTRGLLILAIAGGAVLLLAVLGIGMAIGGMAGKTPAASRTGYSANVAAPVDAGEQGAPTAEPTTGPTPTVKDFALRPKITSKECFGSAGCLLTVKVQAEYVGPQLSPDDTWEITYEINGVEDGPQVGTFTMTGDQYEVNEENVSTKSSKSKVTIKVTSVEKVGL